MILLIVLFVLLMLFVKYKSNNVPGSTGFGSDSLEMYNQMVKAKLSQQSLNEFVAMENKFLNYERMSVCGVPVKNYFTEALELSQVMRERFPAFDFRYHQVHLNQIADPIKYINKELKCAYIL